MLVGSFVNTIDEKGRVFVPAKFREDLGPSFVMLYTQVGSEADGDPANGNGVGCIACYPLELWKEALARMKEMPRSTRAGLRVTMANAMDVEPDKQGRVILSPKLRQLAGLENKTEVIVIGEMNYAELWRKDVWDAYEAQQTAKGGFVLPEDIGL